ncbi:MAG: hypothetical protein IT330_01330 [Anaerolineae bacterium]|nr:hypothetical protein [Anaerolineae bacterium]
MSSITPGQALRDARRREDEEIFLRLRERTLSIELEERSQRLIEEYPPDEPPPPGEADLRRQWQRELELITAVLAASCSEPMEQVLRRWLRRVQRRAVELAAQPRGGSPYPPEYWRCETDRLVLTDLLRRWWQWQGGPQKKQRDI